ncbi:MAG: hypothetical protein A2234_00645 [Elusimicrobia bacterium RIFOXYA2_FULL_58_8]|nr:MAG: hypothetical protein A2285_06545 [Elusimicrobia bacterium RIFOXYA12_FULL_57_11]OGS12721.1 MAG: hypothetical protein A2234_00645 [Elusimicrobia bacterium RIFOXYA2_FULL_58_8]
MKIFWIVFSALLTAAFTWLGHTQNQDFYLAAVISGFALFRSGTGSACPLVWLFTKLGAGGLSCPADIKK